MRKLVLSALFIGLMTVVSCGNKSEKKEVVVSENTTSMNVGVRGNCAMCKHTIETAAKDVEGVVAANWSVEKKKIEVSYDNTKTNQVAIEKAIAASGYDTENVASNEASYSELPGCCQYDHSMEMNQ
ncbi:heavy metal transporter [Wenyingzhuangia fucanilytica]|uniref:Heavy metal transporter n=1 Tax=Wenyingzhuangia fucanilytica TaxID=1790137 RepID=A0A1B1Y467_9FLAO|nr:cation transporter [Wenyingzhuangia fucanilytica]ANW95574.1 heavy metal transporter [Wenyingzhuangia fucanilytica]